MLHIIYNSSAGYGKSINFHDIIIPKLQALQIPYQLYETQYKHHATSIARELTADDKEHTIVAMGGDGTLHEVLNGLHDPSKVCLGILPSGSGNDFASAAMIPNDPLDALDLIINGTPKFTDYMECSGIRGINVIGTGIDVDILKRCYGFKHLQGKLKYLVATLLSLIHFESYRFHLIRDRKEEAHEGFVICAGNGKSIGGGLHVCPEAILDDGLVDFVFIDKISPVQYPSALLHLIGGNILKRPYVLFEQKKHIIATFDNPVPIEIDGEIYEGLDFNIRLIHNSLRIFRP